MRWNTEDTIAAIATPIGIGGVGIVRLSGNKAVDLVTPFFRAAAGGVLADAESHRLMYGWFYDDDEPVDEVMVVVMRAPRSYTREDVVEIHCHGGPLVLRTVLEKVCGSGARLAEPGEFTMRAFFNGRIDLTRVEAVADIVHARSQAGLQVTANQLRGRLYEAIQALREEAARVAALVEAGIDFPEEDIVFAHREEIQQRLEKCRETLERLLATAEHGRIMREGMPTAIVGRPNVGKSSLLNALLRENRAIVTEVPGTTRDTLEEAAEVGGVVLNLVDTAGIRETEDVVEKEGISRSMQAMARAELVLLVLDGAMDLMPEDEALLEKTPVGATLVVLNKKDQMTADSPGWVEKLGGLPQVTVSAKTGEGLEALENWIGEWAFQGTRPAAEHALLTNLRQKAAAEKAMEAVMKALEGLAQGGGDELLSVDLQQLLQALGEIVGETTADDLLNRIFAEFCIGK